jgi:oligopeptide transport system substrate-binding protein
MRIAKALPTLLFALLIGSCDNRSSVEQSTEEGIFVVGNSNEPKGLDPHLVSGVLESNIIGALFEGLAVQDPVKDGDALPGAATSWSSNEDFTVWTFNLQPEGKWSDGVPVTAHDFVFSYQRLLHPELPAKYSEMLYFIKNAEDYNKGKNPDPNSIGARAIDDHTLEITLRGPIPFLPEITKHYTWYPVPRHKVLEFGEIATPFTDWTDPGNMVSNGPFQLKSWRPTHHIEVERNPYYWDAKTVSLNGIRFLPIGNPYTESRMFLDGQLHMTYTLPPEMIPYAQEHIPNMLRQEAYVGVRFIRCNTLRKPLDSPLVRRALAIAIDQASLIDNVLQGGQLPATGITPPFGDYKPPAVVTYNPEEARQLLSQAGFPDGKGFPELKLLTNDKDSARRNAEAFQAMWKDNLNINVRIEQREWTTYLELQYTSDYDLADNGWIGDYLDPTTFLEMWSEGNGNNNTNWSSKEYEAKLHLAENTADPAERLRILAEGESILLEDIPVIPIFWYTTNYLLRPEVKGWSPLLLNNHPLKFVRLEATAEQP